jgi:hypothetical protein
MAQQKSSSGQPEHTIPLEPGQVREGISRKKLLRRYNEADRKRCAREPVQSEGWERAGKRTCSRCGERTKDFPAVHSSPVGGACSAHRSARGSSAAARLDWASEAASVGSRPLTPRPTLRRSQTEQTHRPESHP